MTLIERKPEYENRWLQMHDEGFASVFSTHVFAIPGLGVVMRTTFAPTSTPYPSPGSVSTTLLPNAVVNLKKRHPFSFEIKMEHDSSGVKSGKVFIDSNFIVLGDEDIETEFPPQDE